jgi:hypothetical protein
MNTESYIEGLRAELAAAVQNADKVSQKAVKAELDRVTASPVETATAPDDAEKR